MDTKYQENKTVNNPAVSVIVPVYNAESYLRECLDSALAQTLHDIEIICVNDGSTDTSTSILEEYRVLDNRIRVINKENAGYGAAMNDGLREATGMYIGILESDDCLSPDTYKTYYDFACQHDFPDFVKSDFKRFWGDINNRQYQTIHLTEKKAYYEHEINPSKDLSLLRTNNLTQPGIYLRSFLNNYCVKYNETPGASYQDNGFEFQVFLQAQRAFFIHDELYMIRRDNPNSSVKSKDKVYCMCDEYDFIREWILHNDQLENKQRALEMCAQQRCANYRWTLDRIDSDFRLDFLKRFASDFDYLDSCGELNRYSFTNQQWELINNVRTDYEKYFFEYWYVSKRVQAEMNKLRRSEQKRKKAESELKRIKSSKSYKFARKLSKAKKKAIKIKQEMNSGKNEPSPIPEEYCISDRHLKLSKKNAEMQNLEIAEYPAALEEWYHEITRDVLDLESPITFNHKIQWLKLYDNQPIKALLADKYLVRQWVSDTIGNKYLIPLLGVWDKFDEIDFDSLPERFVLKCNHGSGMNAIIKDKKNLNRAKLKQDFDEWITEYFGFSNGFELQYKDINPKILAEAFIGDGDEAPKDYRFFCFDGEPKSIWVDTDSGTDQHKRDIMNTEWQVQPLLVNYPNIPYDVPKPDTLDEMLEIARKLSEGFAFVRVDLYDADNRIYFGEMTFTPQSGRGRWDPPEANIQYGQWIPVPREIPEGSEWAK